MVPTHDEFQQPRSTDIYLALYASRIVFISHAQPEARGSHAKFQMFKFFKTSGVYLSTSSGTWPDRQTMLVYFTWPTKRPGGPIFL